VEPIVATPRLPLLHIPNGVASVNARVDPRQGFETPEIASGKGLTVKDEETLQPVGNV
jgi:hypothetical protein